MKLHKKSLWTLLVLLGALLASTALIALRPEPKPRAVEEVLPLVGVVLAQPAAERMLVRAQGTLAPRDEIELVAEAAGRVVWISPSFDGAGEFAVGEALVRIAADDYEIAAQRARAAVARAESQRTLARAALSRSEALFDAGATSPAAHEQAAGNAQVAEANLRDAEAARRQAELELARTEIRAPFAGRVRERSVSLGQFLGRNATVARVYAAGGAEGKLALRAEDAAFLDLPSTAEDSGPRVKLSAAVAGARRELAGRIVGSAGALDARTRLLTVTARVDEPTAGAEDVASLAMGVFVDAEIEGRELPGLVKLPRSVLAGERGVVVVDSKNRLEARAVEVLRADDAHVWISRGLAAGERVCEHAPSALAPGTHVRVETLAAGTIKP